MLYLNNQLNLSRLLSISNYEIDDDELKPEMVQKLKRDELTISLMNYKSCIKKKLKISLSYTLL